MKNTVQELISSEDMRRQCTKIKWRVVSELERNLKNFNQYFIATGKEDFLNKYNEYAKLLIKVKQLNSEEFGQFDLEDDDELFKELILGVIQETII